MIGLIRLTLRRAREERLPQLQRFNHIVDPYHLKPGTVLLIPFPWLQLSAAEVRLVALHGDVTLSGADAIGHAPARLGASLEPGARLRTGPSASATLQFSDGTRVLLLPGTELSIAQAGRFPAGAGMVVRLDLIQGSIENLVRPRDGPEGRFEIQTPAAVAAVRGTEFRVRAAPGAAWTEVLGGVVDLGNEVGRQALEPGFGTLVEAGKAPRAPTPLLPRPDLSGLPRLVERLPLDAPMLPIPGAGAYRTLAAPDLSFATVYSNELSSAPRVRIGDIPDGEYLARVRGVDSNGLEGFAMDADDRCSGACGQRTAAGRRSRSGGVLLAGCRDRHSAGARSVRGFPVVSSRPSRPGRRPPEFGGDQLILRWTAAGNGATYHMQLARDESFERPVVDEVLSEAEYVMKKPAPSSAPGHGPGESMGR